MAGESLLGSGRFAGVGTNVSQRFRSEPPARTRKVVRIPVFRGSHEGRSAGWRKAPGVLASDRRWHSAIRSGEVTTDTDIAG